ncbi:MAG: hypothetical protein IT326_01035, partial [Anaerolineae bacterium]|nr:hypothetical protein [Anaerolineae bacterium]
MREPSSVYLLRVVAPAILGALLAGCGQSQPAPAVEVTMPPLPPEIEQGRDICGEFPAYDPQAGKPPQVLDPARQYTAWLVT